MAIYTRAGDAGTTALFAGQHVSKTHPRVEVYGTLGELNAVLGLCVCAAKTPQHRQLPENIQLQLFWFSAELASESEEPTPEQRYISSGGVAALEATISIAMGRIPPLRSFILPGRRETVSRLHFARTLVRHTERRLVELSTEISIRRMLMRYISRLSDRLYALARAEDHDVHRNDTIQKVAERYLVAIQAPAIKEPAMSLSFQELHQLARAAVTRAGELQVPAVISIVDANRIQMVAWRIPDALLMSNKLAPKRAWTAVAMKIATHELTSTVQPSVTLYDLESHIQGKAITFGGGYTSWREGLLLGDLNVSGGSVEQNMDIAETAVTATDVKTHQ